MLQWKTNADLGVNQEVAVEAVGSVGAGRDSVCQGHLSRADVCRQGGLNPVCVTEGQCLLSEVLSLSANSHLSVCLKTVRENTLPSPEMMK